MNPPKARREVRTTRIHGSQLEDPYAWLRNRESKEVLDYLNAENAYAEWAMRDSAPLQEGLYREMLGRIQESDQSAPVKDGDYWYYTRTEQDKQYPIYCRRHDSLEADEAVLLDCNALAEGRDYFQLGALAVSPDHQILAYAQDTDGSERYTLHIKDLRSGALLGDTISGLGGSLAWAQDNRTVFYTILDAAMRPYKLLRHVLGEDPARDALVFHEPDGAFFLSVRRTKSDAYFVLHAHSHAASEAYLLRTDDPTGTFVPVWARRPEIEYDIEHHDSGFYLLTNDGATNFKLMHAAGPYPDAPRWQTVIAPRPDVKLEGIEVFRDWLVVYERERGLNHIRVIEIATGDSHRVEFPETVYTAWGGDNPDYASRVLRFGYTSMITPVSVFDYDMKARARELKKQQPVLGGYTIGDYATERTFATAPDGASVPISLVYKRALRRQEGNPCLLYGYGAYGISIDPEFSSTRLSLLDRGFVYAIAHVRGGGDLGRPWYEAGRRMRKKNTFDDFIACAECLIERGYARGDALGIYGGSAGGMLIGTVVNMRPDLFRAVIAKVPFVDVVNTMLDESLPLTLIEYDEWGNPNERETFEYIYAYAPYEHVKEARYPNILVTGGLNDPRVQYWEPAKWTAKLRAAGAGCDDSLLLLKTFMGAGHGGSSGRYDYLKDIAFEYAFLFKCIPGLESA